MKQWMLSVAMCLVIGGTGTEVGAVSVMIDLDPGTPGIQSHTTIMVGDSIDVGVVVTDVTNLNAYEFDLDFNSSVLHAASLVSGNFLPSIILPPQIAESDVAAPDVNFAEFTIGAFGSSGDGVLALIMFDAVAIGSSSLLLNDVILSAPFGIPISPIALQHGTITVTDVQPVPLPGTLLLFGTGLGGLFAGRWLTQKGSVEK